MKDLTTLIHLHETLLDEHRMALAALEKERDRLKGTMDAIADEVAAERAAVGGGAETGYAFTAYLAGVHERRAALEHAIAALAPQIESAREAVEAAYGELKKYEVTAARRRLAAQQEAARREQAALDEVALGMHRRKSD